MASKIFGKMSLIDGFLVLFQIWSQQFNNAHIISEIIFEETFNSCLKYDTLN